MSDVQMPQRWGLDMKYGGYMDHIEDGDFVRVEDVQPLLAEIERLRAERDVIMREWAIETDESLDETITRNVDGWKQRALKAEADAAALRGALASVVSRHVHENNSHHPEWVAARAALARTGGAS